MAKESAEQKLLKLLETSPQGTASTAGASGSSSGRKSPFKLQLSVKMLNSLLFIGILACLVILLLEIRSGNMLLKRNVEITRETVSGQRLSEFVAPLPKDLAYYTQKISLRNIFKPYEKEQIDKASIPEKPNLSKKLSKYKMVGVAWLDLPESASVMFEDTVTGMTYFLREGEKLDDVTVKTIYTDRVVMSYENEEITIKL